MSLYSECDSELKKATCEMDELVEQIKITKQQNQLNKSIKPLIIAVGGIPGAGKSTFAKELQEKLTNLSNNKDKVVIIPFDGFHKYKNELTQEQINFRGRIDTFDIDKFNKKIKELNCYFIEESNDTPLYFPSFDHSIGDPVEDDIVITKDTEYIIIEGLYLLLPSINCQNYFDIKIFLFSDLNQAMQRVAVRNFKAGITKSFEDSLTRTEKNDKINALYILNNLQLNYTDKTLYIINYILRKI